jgi:preprotein translocase subunit SecA
MDRLGMEEDEPIEHALITKSIETAQKRVEGRNFDIRKQILEYDDVANQQREVIYGQRRKVLFGEEVTHNIFDMVDKIIEQALDLHCDEKVYPEEWDYEGLIEYLEQFFAPRDYLQEDVLKKFSRDELREELQRIARDIYAQREQELGSSTMRDLEKVVMLKVVDQKWLDHIDAMDNLRQGIGLRAYGQKNPLMEYKFEAFEMFNAMIENIQEDIVRFIYHVKVGVVAEDHLQEAKEHHGDEENSNREPVRNKDDIGRNELCPCGSGKKYKKCCGSK